jgi:hypothetical protein
LINLIALKKQNNQEGVQNPAVKVEKELNRKSIDERNATQQELNQ